MIQHTKTELEAALGDLNEAQRNFLNYYTGECIGNARRAYMKAYGAKLEYDGDTADAESSRLIKTDKVAKALKLIRQATAKSAKSRRERVLDGLEKLAFPEDNEVVGHNARIKAMELLGKSEAMFTDNLNVNDTTEQRELTEREAEELRRYAHWRLSEGRACIEGEVVDGGVQEQ